MSLTPLDIRKKEFKKVMRGCDPVEVEAFLELVSDYTMNLINENKSLTESCEHLEAEKKVLIALNEEQKEQKQEDPDTKALAEREASLILKEAEIKAVEILERARSESHRLKDEVMVLKAQKNSFIKRLKHLFSAQLEMIDVLDIEDINKEEFKQLAIKPENKTEVKSPLHKEKEMDLIDLNVLKQNSPPQIDDDLPFIRKKSLHKKERHVNPEDNQQREQDAYKQFIENSSDQDINRILGELDKNS